MTDIETPSRLPHGLDAPTPRHDVEAEQAVLGAVLIDNASLARAKAVLGAEDFYYPPHAAIFDAMLSLHARGDPIDWTTLGAELRAAERYNTAGGGGYLISLLDTIPHTVHVETHARIVAKAARVRRIGSLARDLYDVALRPSIDSDDLAARALSEMEKACLMRDVSGLVALSTDLDGAQERIRARKEHPVGTPTGFPSLDSMTRGLHPGHVWVLAARPGRGKTSFALQVAVNAAQHGTVLFFSLEMPRAELVDRILSTESMTDSQKIARGTLAGDEWAPVVEAQNRLWPNASRFLIDENPEQTAATIRAKAQSVACRSPVVLVVVDYLQLVAPSKERDNREREVAEVSRAMKVVAKECSCAVLLLSQVNRDIERRASKRPTLADLRESGAIEADADLVAFLGSEDEPKDGEKQLRAKVDLDVCKHRHGPTGKIPLGFYRSCTRFDELNPDEAQPEPAKYAPRRGNGGASHHHETEES